MERAHTLNVECYASKLTQENAQGITHVVYMAIFTGELVTDAERFIKIEVCFASDFRKCIFNDVYIVGQLPLPEYDTAVD